jgi:Flp pilus assembly protein TadD
MMNLHAVMALMLFCHAANGLENPERILQQAIVLHQAGQLEPAISQYRAYLKLRPDAVDARSNLGVALASAGHYREAIAEYREALKRRPQDSHIRLNVALAQYKLGQISDAAASLSALHRQQPADRQIILLLADCWLRQGEDRKVIDLVTPVAEQNRDDLVWTPKTDARCMMSDRDCVSNAQGRSHVRERRPILERQTPNAGFPISSPLLAEKR